MKIIPRRRAGCHWRSKPKSQCQRDNALLYEVCGGLSFLDNPAVSFAKQNGQGKYRDHGHVQGVFMENRKNNKRIIGWLMLAIFALTVLYGCETVKGMGKDIKNADAWFREHAW